MMKKKSKNEDFKGFKKDYDDIMNNPQETTQIVQEWTESGDFFKRFSLYENYSPIQSFGGTTLLTEI